ncbi:hypothetical protein JEG43_04955 [Anoxybacillus sp. LAT_35]|nr:hypothetical protein [Anoxybacillus sp. LAT_11]MCG6174296.1 hypothetical protein [Anoxybacillus sp. LAT_31]MCG6177409.1 hypothetical protein [Anoxybacillus sp. LAT_35]MCG6180587.1 hypothetical protein [Anoxybacillus sp. LAT_33]MCG6183945.1 hypothetical protein [Anoxybacillus sp. LAT_26]MCG6198292.1 hypothetical protein [Anoxybacillus sp. LAT_38]
MRRVIILNGKTLIVTIIAGIVLYQFRYRLLNEILKREAVQKRVVQWGMSVPFIRQRLVPTLFLQKYK